MDALVQLFTIIPGGVASAILITLPLLRLLIATVDKFIAQSPDKHDDAGWARIKQSSWFIAIQTLLQITVGLELPKGKK